MPIGSNSIRRARPLLGTFVEIAVAGDDEAALQAAVEAAFDAVAAVHGLMSFHEAGSDVSRLNRDAAARISAPVWRVPVHSLSISGRAGGTAN